MSAIENHSWSESPELFSASLATQQQLLKVHSHEMVDEIFFLGEQNGIIDLDPDTAIMPSTLEAARRAAGAVIDAVDQVMAEPGRAFCAVRPPGHHAESTRGMGFCYFNNIAVGVAHALDTYGLDRIAIVDFDVHYGNGTDDIFGHESRVELFSSYQHPFYPGTPPHTPHFIKLPQGSGGVLFRRQVERQWLPQLHRLKPQLIFISAGFDAHKDDLLGGLMWDETDYRWITRKITDIADQYAKGRVVSSLEGGYTLEALAVSAIEHLAALQP